MPAPNMPPIDPSLGFSAALLRTSKDLIAENPAPTLTFDNSFASNVFAKTSCILFNSSVGILMLSILKFTSSTPNLSNSIFIKSAEDLDKGVKKEEICKIEV